MDVKLKAVSL